MYGIGCRLQSLLLDKDGLVELSYLREAVSMLKRLQAMHQINAQTIQQTRVGKVIDLIAARRSNNIQAQTSGFLHGFRGQDQGQCVAAQLHWDEVYRHCDRLSKQWRHIRSRARRSSPALLRWPNSKEYHMHNNLGALEATAH